MFGSLRQLVTCRSTAPPASPAWRSNRNKSWQSTHRRSAPASQFAGFEACIASIPYAQCSGKCCQLQQPECNIISLLFPICTRLQVRCEAGCAGLMKNRLRDWSRDHGHPWSACSPWPSHGTSAVAGGSRWCRFAPSGRLPVIPAGPVVPAEVDVPPCCLQGSIVRKGCSGDRRCFDCARHDEMAALW